MKILSTFRYVPPIAPEALAWAVVSFATYLAAVEIAPTLGGRAIAPLALAAAVQLTLIYTRNLLSDRFGRAAARAPVAAGLCAVSLFAGLVCLMAFGSDAFAAKLMITLVLFNAMCLTWANAQEPDSLGTMPSSWPHLEDNRQAAILIEAGGQVIAAATLLMVWTHAGALAFTAMMGFGLIYLRMLTNWIIVLYLLDTSESGSRDGD